MANNDFAPFFPQTGTFVVKNISNPKKTIFIFNYPINWMGTRDLLLIPGVGENDIRSSSLKGEINRKIRVNEIQVLSSNVDLLQFDPLQRQFLLNAGITNGLDASGSGGGLTPETHETLLQLIHFIDTPGPTHGFPTPALRVITGTPFPSSIVWFYDLTATKKLVEKLIIYNSSNIPTITTWNMYAADGSTIIHTITDAITYTNDVFEQSRVRTIS